MTSRATSDFDDEWQISSAPPNLSEYLATRGIKDIREQISILVRDQLHRYQHGILLPVEQYLSSFPQLRSDRNAMLKLIVHEFELRGINSAHQRIQEVEERFPEFAHTILGSLSLDATIDSDLDNEDRTISFTAPQELIGRYRLDRVLGRGGYGCVYLGFDDSLQRPVAVKVPNTRRFREPAEETKFLTEARLVASLSHPNIVPVYDLGKTREGAIYIVSKYIDGLPLRELIHKEPLPFDRIVQILIGVANALQHAHERRIIHRDVKPGNILIEAETGTPYVTDFGLALHDTDDRQFGMIAGTPSYMSPEQARGEGHRLDGRSDLFALGAVMYEMLTNHRTFLGATTNEILYQVVSEDPAPPISRNPSIPPELDRICRKALSKKISARHGSVAEFANDLGHWQSLRIESSPGKPIAVVPHGLRSFDSTDADFFLDLLPDPRNRDGIPESVAFWIKRLEANDPDQTFRVGLIYGPSGCGKSSLVKAGVLPRLSEKVKYVYLEATASDTESRLLRAIRKRFAEAPHNLDLVSTMRWLRQDSGCKTVFIIDQFEQWLHSHTPEPNQEMLRALGQCDGGSLQAVIMIRDDFAMAAARFMETLDIPIVQGENFATVDLFDESHAKKVLIKFGQAFGKLPLDASQLDRSQSAFLDAVIKSLSNGGQIVPVHQALFSEMIKKRPWEAATLVEVGGAKGVGVSFLEETFCSRSSNPAYRKHEHGAREVLKALLPGPGSDIKGNLKPHEDLQQIAGYHERDGEFHELLRILDGSLRLITPTDSDSNSSDSGSGYRTKHYQLTHDYLVPSLREWLSQRQRLTRHGRAELRLDERQALWSVRREMRQLPTFVEWLSNCLVRA